MLGIQNTKKNLFRGQISGEEPKIKQTETILEPTAAV